MLFLPLPRLLLDLVAGQTGVRSPQTIIACFFFDSSKVIGAPTVGSGVALLRTLAQESQSTASANVDCMAEGTTGGNQDPDGQSDTTGSGHEWLAAGPSKGRPRLDDNTQNLFSHLSGFTQPSTQFSSGHDTVIDGKANEAIERECEKLLATVHQWKKGGSVTDHTKIGESKVCLMLRLGSRSMQQAKQVTTCSR